MSHVMYIYMSMNAVLSGTYMSHVMYIYMSIKLSGTYMSHVTYSACP